MIDQPKKLKLSGRIARCFANHLPRSVVAWCIVRAAATVWPDSTNIKKLGAKDMLEAWCRGLKIVEQDQGSIITATHVTDRRGRTIIGS